MAPSASEFGDEIFEEYNPHPFQGGYDIQKTYGQSLPPSSQICYPISSPASTPVSKPLPTFVADQSEENSDRCEVQDFSLPEYNYPPHSREASSEVYGRRSASTPFDEVHGRCRMRDHNSLNWAVDYLFTYFRTYGDKRAESFSYGNLNYAYEKHQPPESLSIQSNPYEFFSHEQLSHLEHYQEEEQSEFFQDYEEKKVEIHDYSIPREGLFGFFDPYEHYQEEKQFEFFQDYEEKKMEIHDYRIPREGLFGFFNPYEDKRIEECSYQRQQPQETLSIQFDPQENLAYEEVYHYPLDSSSYGVDFYKGQQSEDSYLVESYSHAYHLESSDEVYPQEDYVVDFDPAEQKSTDHGNRQNYDFFGIFDSHESSHQDEVGAYEVKYYEKSVDNDGYDEQSWYPRHAGYEQNEHDDAWTRSVDQSYFFGQHSFFDN